MAARTLLSIPPSAKRGEVIEIRTTIGHPMETGFRPDANGQVLPRDIIKRFSARFSGQPVFSAELFSAVAANPYIAFFMRLEESGTLVLSWEGDNGFAHSENVQIVAT